MPCSWRVPAPTLLCSGLGVSRLLSHPGAVGGDKESWKVVSPSDGPDSGKGLAWGSFDQDSSLSFPDCGELWDLPEGWGAGAYSSYRR